MIAMYNAVPKLSGPCLDDGDGRVDEFGQFVHRLHSSMRKSFGEKRSEKRAL